MNGRLGAAVRGVGILIVLWWGLSVLAGGVVVPSPWVTLAEFFRLLPGPLWRHAAASLGRVIVALGASAAVAVPLGIAVGRVPSLDGLFSPLTYLLYPVPKIALLPVVILLFGIGNVAKVLLVCLVLFFQILVAVRDGARSVESGYLLAIRSLGARPFHVFRYVIWPALLPRLLTALRIGSGTALAVLFFAETFFTRYGLGFYIVDAWTRLAYTQMFAGIVAIGLTGLLLFACIDVLERRYCGWQRSRERQRQR